MKKDYRLTDDDVSILVKAKVIPENTDRSQIDLFARMCYKNRLDPFSGEVHLTRWVDNKKKAHYTIITGIDAFRKRASSTGLYAGKTDALYNKKSDGTFLSMHELKTGGFDEPKTCTITVRKIVGGVVADFTATVSFDEFCQYAKGQKGSLYKKGKWATMPFHMIAKCAEALALRMAFSEELGGLHIAEEMGAFDDGIKEEINNQKQVEDIMQAEKLDDDKKKKLIASVKSSKDMDHLMNLWNNNVAYTEDKDIKSAFVETRKKIQGPKKQTSKTSKADKNDG